MPAKVSIAQKFAQARELQPSGLTQADVAELLHVSRSSYQSYEMGRVESRKKLEPIVEKLSEAWKIPADWFWDGRLSDPYENTWLADEVKVPVYHAGPALPLLLKEDHIEMISIDADVAKSMKDSKGIELPDTRMSPRFLPGQRLFGRPTERLLINRIYIAERKSPEVNEEFVEIVVGVYVVKDSEFFLKPINDSYKSADVRDLCNFRLVIASQEAVNGNKDWVEVEKYLRDGLPVERPSRQT